LQTQTRKTQNEDFESLQEQQQEASYVTDDQQARFVTDEQFGGSVQPYFANQQYHEDSDTKKTNLRGGNADHQNVLQDLFFGGDNVGGNNLLQNMAGNMLMKGVQGFFGGENNAGGGGGGESDGGGENNGGPQNIFENMFSGAFGMGGTTHGGTGFNNIFTDDGEINYQSLISGAISSTLLGGGGFNGNGDRNGNRNHKSDSQIVTKGVETVMKTLLEAMSAESSEKGSYQNQMTKAQILETLLTGLFSAGYGSFLWWEDTDEYAGTAYRPFLCWNGMYHDSLEEASDQVWVQVKRALNRTTENHGKTQSSNGEKNENTNTAKNELHSLADEIHSLATDLFAGFQTFDFVSTLRKSHTMLKMARIIGKLSNLDETMKYLEDLPVNCRYPEFKGESNQGNDGKQGSLMVQHQNGNLQQKSVMRRRKREIVSYSHSVSAGYVDEKSFPKNQDQGNTNFNFRLAVMSDPQLGFHDAMAGVTLDQGSNRQLWNDVHFVMENEKNNVNPGPFLGILIPGDLTNTADVEEWGDFMAVYGGIYDHSDAGRGATPVYPMLGNHDYETYCQSNRDRKGFPWPPEYWSARGSGACEYMVGNMRSIVGQSEPVSDDSEGKHTEQEIVLPSFGHAHSFHRESMAYSFYPGTVSPGTKSNINNRVRFFMLHNYPTYRSSCAQVNSDQHRDQYGNDAVYKKSLDTFSEDLTCVAHDRKQQEDLGIAQSVFPLDGSLKWLQGELEEMCGTSSSRGDSSPQQAQYAILVIHDLGHSFCPPWLNANSGHDGSQDNFQHAECEQFVKIISKSCVVAILTGFEHESVGMQRVENNGMAAVLGNGMDGMGSGVLNKWEQQMPMIRSGSVGFQTWLHLEFQFSESECHFAFRSMYGRQSLKEKKLEYQSQKKVSQGTDEEISRGFKYIQWNPEGYDGKIELMEC